MPRGSGGVTTRRHFSKASIVVATTFARRGVCTPNPVILGLFLVFPCRLSPPRVVEKPRSSPVWVARRYPRFMVCCIRAAVARRYVMLVAPACFVTLP